MGGGRFWSGGGGTSGLKRCLTVITTLLSDRGSEAFIEEVPHQFFFFKLKVLFFNSSFTFLVLFFLLLLHPVSDILRQLQLRIASHICLYSFSGFFKFRRCNFFYVLIPFYGSYGLLTEIQITKSTLSMNYNFFFM